MRDPIERQNVFDLLNSVSPYIGSWLIQYIDDAISSIPSAQPVEKDINVPCKDTISRQDAIDALDNIKIPRNASWYPYYQQALTAMSRLPSAQPEPEQNTMPEQLKMNRFGVKMGKTCTDAISRQDAIDAVNTALFPKINTAKDAEKALRNLPPAQPEIIRCKDCKWKQGAECVRFAEIRPFPDDFCSRGERRAYG